MSPTVLHLRVSVVNILTLVVIGGILRADEPAPNFSLDIRPILSNRCFKCHGPGTQSGDLRLDHRDAAIAAQAIVPGDLAASELVRRITATDETRMPPLDAGDALSPREIETLQRWIAAGAPYSQHWAFVAPTKAPPPSLQRTDWAINEIDPFVLAKLEAAAVAPSPEADRRTLARRVSLDLLGLPPTVDDVEAFVVDPSPDAYERFVDRVLASPAYGERQTRHWLDMARYADSNGYTIDGPRSIWPWRDWTIDAMNADMPFDQFTIEQLAGDLLPNATREQLVATGFHRNTPFNQEGGTDPEQFRAERTVDRTNTTGAVWLGLTLGCAQCHDHKYDPLSQREYFQLYAFFNAIDEQEQMLPTETQQAKVASLTEALAAAKTAPPPVDAAAIDVDTQIVKLREQSKTGYPPFAARDARSEQGAQLERLDDLSLVASGPDARGEVYILEGWQRLTQITAVRVEALPDDRYPAGGPGRGDGGSFALSELEFWSPTKRHKFANVLVDRAAPGFDPAKLLAGDRSTGWSAPPRTEGEPATPATAVFILEQPAAVNDSINLKFILRFADKQGAALGRFRVSVTNGDGPFVTLPVDAQRLLLKPKEEFSAEDRAQVAGKLGDVAAKIAMQERVAAIEKELKDAQTAIPSTMVCRPVATPRADYIHVRGDFLSKGDAVVADVPAVFPGLGENSSRSRLELARWLTRPDHPLTARVLVNRAWQYRFGKGLVETENDFGMQGAVPTHPELLDTLAVWFVEHGFSRKALDRLLVTSATYRQSSAWREDLQRVDPLNRLLGRQNRLRLEAESVRDAALAVSGRLTHLLGGPGVFPPQPIEVFSFTQNKREWVESQGAARYRRGLYTHLWRQSQHPLMTTFDAPDAQTACTRRNRSNTPLQALHLANDTAFVELAESLGKRAIVEAPTPIEERARWLFQTTLQRPPTAAEAERIAAFARGGTHPDDPILWARLARVLMNLDEFVVRD